MKGYVIETKSSVTEEMWSKCLCNADTARASIDGSKVLLKFEASAIPSVFDGKTILSKTEARQATQSEEWCHDN
tara:strand:+ start:1523 stop:1744 length:222 start_codon:yes stop_codon:yes gene_type:complete